MGSTVQVLIVWNYDICVEWPRFKNVSIIDLQFRFLEVAVQTGKTKPLVLFKSVDFSLR